jgi:hypothetical protein
MAAKIEPTERQSAGAAAGSDDLNQQLRSVVAERIGLQPTSPEEDEPVERDDLRPVITSHLNHEASERKAIYDRLVAIENEVKKRGSRRPRWFRRYLVAILIGVAATLAWQSYGESAKQVIATRAPEIGWSPEAKQMIATSIQWIGWTKPPAGQKQAPPVAQTASSTTSTLDPGQMQQIARDLATLREMVQQLTAGQDQTTREIAKLESAVVEILMKTPEPPPQPPAAPARKPTPAPPSSRTPIPPRV